MDWAGLMQAGLHRLGLNPNQFWALTPFELQTMLGVSAADQPMRRTRFTELLAAYPDQTKDKQDGRD